MTDSVSPAHRPCNERSRGHEQRPLGAGPPVRGDAPGLPSRRAALPGLGSCGQKLVTVSGTDESDCSTSSTASKTSPLAFRNIGRLARARGSLRLTAPSSRRSPDRGPPVGRPSRSPLARSETLPAGRVSRTSLRFVLVVVFEKFATLTFRNAEGLTSFVLRADEGDSFFVVFVHFGTLAAARVPKHRKTRSRSRLVPRRSRCRGAP